MTDPNHPSPSPRVHYGVVVLALIVLAVFGSLGLARFGYTSILPAMQEGIHLTNRQTGELQSWNLLGYMLTVVAAGVLATRFGPRVVITIALLVTGTGLVLTGLVPTFNGARVGRFLAGVGGAGGNVPAVTLVAAWYGARRRGMASGIAVAGSSVGLMVTGPLVPFLLNRFEPDGWRVCWYVLGAMAYGVAILCAFFLRNRSAEMNLRPLGESDVERRVSDAAPRTSALAWSQVYRSRLLWHLAAVYFGFGFSYIIYSTFLVRYLVGEVGFSQEEAGLVWFTIGLVSGVSGFLWGCLSDRWGRRAALVGVFAVQGLSFLMIGSSRELPLVLGSAALFALTAWSIPALMAALCGDLFGARLAPAALGLMTIVFGVGQVLGPWVAGGIADTTKSFSLAFLAAAAVALVLGAGGSLMLRMPR